jgi:hypothetical protein
MTSTIPTPIEFALPAGWIATPPDDVGAAGAAFVALRPDAQTGGFIPNITMAGECRSENVSFGDLADQSIAALDDTCAAAALSTRTEIADDGTAAAGLTQLVRIRLEVHGVELDVAQCQVYLALDDIEEDGRHVVLRFSLTATADQISEVVGDFQQFLASVHPAEVLCPRVDRRA